MRMSRLGWFGTWAAEHAGMIANAKTRQAKSDFIEGSPFVLARELAQAPGSRDQPAQLLVCLVDGRRLAGVGGEAAVGVERDPGRADNASAGFGQRFNLFHGLQLLAAHVNDAHAESQMRG